MHRLILVTCASICPDIQGLAYTILTPSELTHNQTIHVLQTNAETFACPPGYYVLHFYALDPKSSYTCQELMSPLINAFFPFEGDKQEEDQTVLVQLYTSKRMKRPKARSATDSHEPGLFICQERLEPSSSVHGDGKEHDANGLSCFQACLQEAQSIYCEILALPQDSTALFPAQKDHAQDWDED